MNCRKYISSVSILLFLMLLFANTAIAEKKKGIVVFGTYKIDRGTNMGTNISLFQAGKKVQKNVGGDGTFKYSLLFNKQYEIVFSKEGYITKKVYVSTDVPERVLKSNNEFPPFKVDITLYKKVKGEDYSIFDEPVAMVIYDKELDDFDFDKAYNVEMKEKIEEIESKLAVTKVEPKNDNLKLYREKIKIADNLFAQKSFDEARKSYQEAIVLNGKESYPKSQLKKIDKELKLLAQNERAKEEEEKLNQAYEKAVAKADELLAQQEYKKAKSGYKKALDIKSKESYPKEKIRWIDDFILKQDKAESNYKRAISKADKYLRRDKYEDAKVAYQEALEINQEAYPKEKIAEIEKLIAEQSRSNELDKEYNEAIQKADDFFDSKEWNNSKDFYTQALKIKPNERYPNRRLLAIDAKIKQLEEKVNREVDKVKMNDKKEERTYAKLELKKEEASKPEKNDQFEELKTKGDKAFVKKDWTQARMHYFKALKDKPDSEYVSNKIADIDSRLLDEESKKKMFNNLYAEAGIAYAEEEFDKAIDLCKKAEKLFPDKEELNELITKIKKGVANKKLRDGKKSKFEDALAKAEDSSNRKDWIPAIKYYRQALAIKNTKALRERVKYCRDAIEKEKQNMLAEADKKRRYCNRIEVSKEQKSHRYFKRIEIGKEHKGHRYFQRIETTKEQKSHKYYDRKETTTAQKSHRYYDRKEVTEEQKAQKYYSSVEVDKNNESTKKVERIELPSKKTENANQYNEFIVKAEKAVAKKDYESAKEYYQQAYNITPSPVLLEKIKKITDKK